jgi:hypothetical protein
MGKEFFENNALFLMIETEFFFGLDDRTKFLFETLFSFVR